MNDSLLTRLNERPIFVLTSDQDWATPWAAEQFLELVGAYDLPLHVFRTNPCPSFDQSRPAMKWTQGWHPNFLPGSSHGKTRDEVIQYFQAHFPQATSVRSHCFYEDTYAWQLLADSGIRSDSQPPTRFQPNLIPIVHFTGILRLPIYFEDDVFFTVFSQLDLSLIQETLFSPGLKILNFHPTFVGFNIPSRDYYDARKTQIFSGKDAHGLTYDGRGTRQVFRELIETIFDRGERFHCFESIAEQLHREVPAC